MSARPSRFNRASEAGDVLFVTRLLAAVIIPFLLAAAVILIGWPEETDDLFAWGIGPEMTAFALGAAYLSGVLFFGHVLLERDWMRIAVGFPAVFLFASLLAIATVIHWENFNHDHVAFWAWAVLYFTTPWLVLGVWLVNSRAAPQDGPGPRMETGARIVLVAIGLVALVIAGFLYLFPAEATDVWPWTLSSLTARVMAATFALPAAVHIGMAVKGRWRALPVLLQAQAFAFAVVLVGLVRAWSNFSGSEAEGWAFSFSLLGLLVITSGLYVLAIRRMAMA